MGIVTMGPDFRLIQFIKEKYNVKNFIETGTFYGGTTEWAAPNFEHVHSIEFSEHWYKTTKERLSHLNNVQIHYGDTRSILPKLLEDTESAVLWLDAHWCSDHSYGEDDQCPLLDELAIINSFTKLQDQLFILIDDARLFLAPPHQPHALKDYPDIVQIINSLTTVPRKIYVFNDIIIGVPLKFENEFDAFLQHIATIDLNKAPELLKTPKKSLFKRILRKLSHLLKG